VDRCAIFVDVGYLLAEGGKACCGTTTRSQARCDYAATSSMLEDVVTERSQLPLPRSYWYDGSLDYMPTQDHHVIAGLPRVKLRLGRLVMRKGKKGNAYEQKGVDSLIVHDLITLAHERAVSTIFLLAGDEDLREGVAAAQRLGVQVVVLGIPTSRPNQSAPLLREADEVVLVEVDRLKPHFKHAGVEPGMTEDAPLANAAKADPEAAVSEAAKAFAATWAQAAELSEVGDLLARAPRIPKELDVQLLLAAEEAVGFSLRDDQTVRYALRAAFWDQITAQAQQQDHSKPDDVDT
jgi:uncharacterized LabA/DUF88 family protein